MARRVLAAAAMLVLLPAVTAEANTRQCRQLEAQLASLPAGGGGSSAQARRYDAAIQRQQEQMRKAREQAQRAGCGRAMAGRAIAFCGSLTATLSRMETNLSQLQRERARLGGGGDNRRERARLLAAIDANGCRAPRREETARARSRTDSGAPAQAIRTPPVAARNLTGNYRTLCVRSCDGYYFPISWSVSQSAFERDQNVCQAMCPGTAVELHFHHSTAQESEEMVSAVTGRPYTEMPNAFRYRQPGAPASPGCGCGAAAASERGFTVIGGDYRDRDGGETGTQERTAAIIAPSLRTSPAEDAPSARDDAETAVRADPPARRLDDDDEERAVRVVGPTFLPDPEGAIDLQAPVRSRVR